MPTEHRRWSECGYQKRTDWQRPIGVRALEDKIVQRSTVEVLNAIYEADFSASPTDFALDAASIMSRTPCGWV